jgi:hypothetical protein
MLTGARPLVAEGKGKAVEVAAKIVGTSKTLVQDALLLSKKSTAVHRDAEPDTPGTRPARRAPGPRTNAQGLRETGAGAAPGASWCVLSRCVYDRPLPGIPTVSRTWPWPMVTCAPLTPIEVETPRRDRFSVTPGRILMRRKKRRATGLSSPARLFAQVVEGLDRRQ